MNLYAYVGNDPMNGTDPAGEQSWTDAIPTPRELLNAIGDTVDSMYAVTLGTHSDQYRNPTARDYVNVGLAVATVLLPEAAAARPASVARPAGTARPTAGRRGVPVARRGNNPWGGRGAPDHSADVRGGGRAQAESEARAGETVLTEQRLQGHEGVNRRPDNQVVDANGRTRLVVETERNPSGTYHRRRVDEYSCHGIECQTRPLPPRQQ